MAGGRENQDHLASNRIGQLNTIEHCWIRIPTRKKPVCIRFRAMPTISDTKGARYNDESIIGRSTPLVTYSHSENRIITMDIPFVATDRQQLLDNAEWMRAIESATYPTHEDMGTPYTPPVVCKIHCGELLDARRGGCKRSKAGVCAVLEKYSMKFDPSVPMDPVTYVPFIFTMSTTWRVVYKPQFLPGAKRIMRVGY